jgi:O-antigen/teichoic acid export membrane protein
LKPYHQEDEKMSEQVQIEPKDFLDERLAERGVLTTMPEGENGQPRGEVAGACPSPCMNDHKQVLRGTLSDMCSLGITVLSGVVYGIALIRFLGPEQFGIYSIAITYTELFGSVAAMGMSWYLTDAIARDRAASERLVGLALPFHLIIIVLIACALVVTGKWVMCYSGTVFVAICALTVALVMNQLYFTIYSVFRAFERLELNTLVQVVAKGAYVTAGLVLLATIGGVRAAVGVQVGAAALQLALGWRFLRPLLGKVEWRFPAPQCFALLRRLLPFALSSFLITFRANACVVALGKFVSPTEVGYFTGAYKLAALVTLVAVSWGNALFPVMTRYGQSNPEGLRSLYRLVVRFALGFGLPVFLALFALSDLFIRATCGRQFQPSGPTLKILAAYGAISLFTFPMGNLLVALERPQLTTRALGVGALGLLCFSVLIMAFGARGAAFALAASEALVALFYWWYARRLLGVGARCPGTARIIGVVSVLAIPLFLVATQPMWAQYTALAVVAMIYGVVCWKAGFLDEREREGLAQMTRNVFKPFRWRRA